MSAADTQALLASRGLALPDPLAAELHAHTEGNAELLTLALGVLAQGQDPQRLLARLAETGSVARFLMSEVDAGLTETERAVMGGLAALLGYPATRDAVEALLQNGGGARRALHGLSARYLLAVRQGEWGSEYSQHALVREFYYDLLGRREREGMHRRAGAYYERVEPDPLKGARHYLLAGEHERAAALATADVLALINQGQARELGLLLEHFEAQQLQAETWVKVNLAQGQVYALLGDGRWARASYEEALESLDRLPDPASGSGQNLLQVRELRARACQGIGDSLRYESPREALAWLRQGLSQLAGTSSQEEGALRIEIGRVQINTGDFANALCSIEQGLALLPDGPSPLRATALLNVGNIYAYQGDLKRSTAFSLRALEISEQLHDHFRLVGIWNNLGIDQDIAGEWEDAVATYEQALDLARRLGDVKRQTGLELALGNLDVKRGNHETAGAHFFNCLALAREHRLSKHLVWANSSLSDLYLRQGEDASAEPLLIEAKQVALALGTKAQLPEIYRRWAQLLLVRGNTVAAVEHAQRSVSLAREREMGPEEGMCLHALGQALLANGQYEPALKAFEDSLLLLAGQDPYEAARTKVEWGRALLAGPEAKRGIALLQEAQDTFEGLGARRDLGAVKKVLGALSVARS